MKNVLVMLSTYNGEKYLREQIESVLKQENVKISILVRDDGSTDNTCNILEEKKKKGLTHYQRTKNIFLEKRETDGSRMKFIRTEVIFASHFLRLHSLFKICAK